MSLLQRKRRPLTRDADTLRDDRLFIVACDDTYAPKQYFDFFKIGRIQVHVVPTQDGTSTASHVLDRLLNCEHEADDELWMLLDTDHFTSGPHIKSFRAAIKRAKQNGVRVALSKPCFELWLLLHHVEESDVAALADATEVESTLRNALGSYDKTRLKRDHYPFGSVREACRRADRLDAATAGVMIPTTNTTRVYLLWKAIAAKALPTQLPPELRELVP